MIFSKEAEFTCFEKVPVSQTQNLEKREGKATIHEPSLTAGKKIASMLYFHRGELKTKMHKSKLPTSDKYPPLIILPA